MIEALFLFSYWCVCLVAWLCESRRTKYRLGPFFVLCAMLASVPTVFMLPGFVILKAEPPLEAYWLYLFGMVGVILGYACFVIVGSGKVLRPLPSRTFERLFLIACLLSLTGLGFAAATIIKFGFQSGALTSAESYIMRQSAAEEGGGTLAFAIDMFLGSFRQIASVSILVAILTLKRNLRIPLRIVGWSVVCFWLAVELMGMARGSLVFPILVILLVECNFRKKIPWRKIIGGTALICLVIWGLSLIRSASHSDRFYGRSFSHPGVYVELPFWSPNPATWLVETVIYYQGHGFGNFGAMLANKSEFRPSLGHESVRGSSYLFRTFAPPNWYRWVAESATINTDSRKRIGSFRQWSTWFGALFQSFGSAGVPVVMFFTGICFAYFQRFGQREGGVVERLVFVSLTLIAFSAPAPYFLGTVGGFGVALFSLLLYIFVKTHRR